MTIITFDNLSKADGSALVEDNGTIVQATVFGPADIAQSKQNQEEAIIEVTFKPRVSIPPSNPAFDCVREMENTLHGIFSETIVIKQHPRTCVSILVQEIQDSGSLFSAAINAANCALIDAGVPLKSSVVAITTASRDASCKLDLVFDGNLDIITILTHGTTDGRELKETIAHAKEIAKNHLDQIRERVRERYRQRR